MFPIINFFGTAVDTYALSMLLSFLTVLIAVLLSRPKELPYKYVFWATIIVFFFSLLGATLLNALLHAPEYKGKGIYAMLKGTGFAYLGAPIMSLFAFWIFCRFVRIPFPVFADFAAPFFMLDRLIGRLGCLGYGCCYGIPSNLPWAYPFKSCGISNVVPRHPTQAYAMISALAIFASSRYLYKRLKPIPGIFSINYKEAPSAGITFFYVFFCYSFLRFFNDFLRAEGPFACGSFKVSQIALVVFAIILGAGLFILIKKSAAKGEILKILKGAFARLVVWFIVSGVVILSAITLYQK